MMIICACGCGSRFNKTRPNQIYYRGHQGKKPLINGIDRSQWKREYRKRNKNNIKIFIQERIAQWRAKPGPVSNLDSEYLLWLYEYQNGRCFYTGEKLIFNAFAGKPLSNSLSLDRLDPHKGYVKGNVVWCSYFVNTMKGNLTYRQFINKLNKIIEYRT